MGSGVPLYENEQMILNLQGIPTGPEFNPQEYKVVALRECPIPSEMSFVGSPENAARYWQRHIESHPLFNRDLECLVVLLLNTRHKVMGHSIISIGTLDKILASARDLFRPAVIAAAAAIVMIHNHPSGDPSPSEGDIAVTREMARAGSIMNIELLDHIIITATMADGQMFYQSLREKGVV